MPPLVSIVVPTRNRAELLGPTLDSLRAQTYPHWEALFVDDGSTDDTVERLTDAAAVEPRFRWWRRTRPNAGAPACRNEGALAAAGAYVIFLDSDDLLEPTCLENRVAVMERNPGAGFAVFPTAVFERRPWDTGRFWNAFDEQNDLDRFLVVDVPWQTTAPIWRRGAVAAFGLWDEQAKRWQDWEFHVRALAAGLAYVKEPTPDHHWRSGGHASISRGDATPEAYESHLQLLPRVTDELRKAGALTPDRRDRLAALFLFMAGQCAREARDVPLALRLWDAARAASLVGPVVHRLGRLYLPRCDRRSGWRIHRRLLAPLMPYAQVAGRSKTRFLTRTPVKGTAFDFSKVAGAPFGAGNA